MRYIRVDPREIWWPEWAKREYVDEKFIDELGRDMALRGQDNPVIATMRKDGRLVGIKGWQRCMAAMKYGLEVEVKVVDEESEWDEYVNHVKENRLRRGLSVWDTARKIAHAVEVLGRPKDAVASLWGFKSTRTIDMYLELHRFPREVKDAVGARRVSPTKLLLLKPLVERDPKLAAEVARWIAEYNPTRDVVKQRVRKVLEKGRFEGKEEKEREAGFRRKSPVSTEEARKKVDWRRLEERLEEDEARDEAMTAEEARAQGRIVPQVADEGPDLNEPRLCVFDEKYYPMWEMWHVWMHKRYWRPFVECLPKIKQLLRAAMEGGAGEDS